MNGLHFKLETEPNDKYEKAKKDMMQAINSLQELSPEQRRQLEQEALGSQLAMQVFNLFPKLF